MRVALASLGGRKSNTGMWRNSPSGAQTRSGVREPHNSVCHWHFVVLSAKARRRFSPNGNDILSLRRPLSNLRKPRAAGSVLSTKRRAIRCSLTCSFAISQPPVCRGCRKAWCSAPHVERPARSPESEPARPRHALVGRCRRWRHAADTGRTHARLRIRRNRPVQARPTYTRGFYLDKDDLPEADSDSKLWGVNYEYAT